MLWYVNEVMNDKIRLCCREKNLLAWLYVLVWCFICVAPILWISLNAYIRELRENLLGKANFVKIGPKISRCLTVDLSMIQCIRRHCISIKTLRSNDVVWGFLSTSRGVNVTRTRHNLKYNVPCRVVLNRPRSNLVTFVHCIYQHKRSRYWSVFLSPDVVTLDGIQHRRNYNIRFVHINAGSMLPTWRSVSVQHRYMWWLCLSDVSHNMLLIGTDCLQFYVHGKHICQRRVCESTEQGAEQKQRDVYEENIFLIEQQIKYRNRSVHLFCRYATAIAS
jgi:hypothetical protein